MLKNRRAVEGIGAALRTKVLRRIFILIKKKFILFFH